MKFGHPAERDRYGQRILAAIGAAVLAFVVGSLLSPSGDPSREWYEHTGIEGPPVLLDDIVIVPDVAPITQTPLHSMPNPTEGVSPPLVEETVVERTENPLPRVDEMGRPNPRTEMRRLTEGADDLLDPADRVQMSRPAQRSLQFVLLHSVSPEYPDGVSPGLRRREIVVRVNLFIDEQGRVAHAYVDRNNGGPLFEEAVLVAVRQWIYRPLEMDGKPQGFWDHIYFVFNMAPSPRKRG